MAGAAPSDLARALVRRHREVREHYEQRARELRAAVAEEANALIAEGLARRAWLVGSLAWGEHGPRSDVDIVLDGLPRTEQATVWDRLCGRLGVSVDLLRLEDLSDSFRERVLADGVPFHHVS